MICYFCLGTLLPDMCLYRHLNNQRIFDYLVYLVSILEFFHIVNCSNYYQQGLIKPSVNRQIYHQLYYVSSYIKDNFLRTKKKIDI